MYQDMLVMISDFRKTYSELASKLARSSSNAPYFLYGWTKYLVSKFFSIGTFAIVAVAIVAAVEFFGILAASLFVGGQILPAIACLIPIALCLAACVPLFNQLLRITGIADRALTQKDAGKTMQFFGKANVPSRKTPAEQAALAQETEAPQLQVTVNPRLPSFLSWINISYLIAPSDVRALPEYVRLLGNAIMYYSGIERYAASLDSPKARAKLEKVIKGLGSTEPISLIMANVESAKDISEKFTTATTVHNNKMNGFVQELVGPRKPEFATYYEFLKSNPVNTIYRNWHTKYIARHELEFKAASSRYIALLQDKLRLEEIQSWPVIKRALNPIIYYQASNTKIPHEQIQEAQQQLFKAHRRYTLVLSEAEALAKQLKFESDKAEVAKENKTEETVAELRATTAEIVAKARDNAREVAEAALAQATQKLNKAEHLLANTAPNLALIAEETVLQAQKAVTIAEEELSLISEHRTFIEEFESKFNEFKQQYVEPQGVNKKDTPSKLPEILLLNRNIGVYVDTNPKVLTEKQADEKAELEHKINKLQLKLHEFKKKFVATNSVLDESSVEYAEIIERIEGLFFQNRLSEVQDHKDQFMNEIKNDPDYKIFENVNKMRKELSDLSLQIQQVELELISEYKMLAPYSDDHQDILHSVKEVASIVEAKIANYSKVNSSDSKKDKKIYTEAYTNAMAVKVDRLTAELKSKITEVEQLYETYKINLAASEPYKQALTELEQIKQNLILAYEELPSIFYKLLIAALNMAKQESTTPNLTTPDPMELTAENTALYNQALQRLAEAKNDLASCEEKLPASLYKMFVNQVRSVATENAAQAALKPEQSQLTPLQQQYFEHAQKKTQESRIIGLLHDYKSKYAITSAIAKACEATLVPDSTEQQEESEPTKKTPAAKRKNPKHPIRHRH